jgi:hypothetical protein
MVSLWQLLDNQNIPRPAIVNTVKIYIPMKFDSLSICNQIILLYLKEEVQSLPPSLLWFCF